MIDYFTHFIYIQFHLFRRNDAAAVNHRADFADKRTDFLRIHSRLLRNPAERCNIILNFGGLPGLFGQERICYDSRKNETLCKK